MNESVSPQRRRPPGWRAARAAPETEAAPPSADATDGPAADPAFARGETAERPAIRIPADDHDDQDDDHPVFGSRRDDDRTRTMDAVPPSRREVDRPDEDELDQDAAGDDDADDEPSADGHPVAVPLGGFFTGMAYILVLPVLYVWLSDPDSIADAIGVDLVWLVAAILVPVFLTAIPQTRKFGRYMLLGVGLSAVIVIGVAAVVLAVLIFLA